MNNVTIKRIKIKNFKGIVELEQMFDKSLTRILGENGSGKSTIKNAWEWCLCQNVEDYIPMINNKEVENLITSVTAEIEINGIDYELSRTSKPVVSKTTGKTNKLSYAIDGIELNKTSYTEKISQLLGAGTIDYLPILTDKEFFNSDTTKWKWNNRRELLLSKCDVEKESEQLINSGEFDLIKNYIIKGFQTSEIQSTILKEKKDLRKRQEENAIKIESKTNEINEYIGIDFESISKELSVVKAKLTKLNNSTVTENIKDKYKDISEKIAELTIEVDKLRTADALKLKEEKSKLVKLFDKAYDWKCDYENKLTIYNKHIDDIEEKQNSKLICPHCKKQVFDITEEMQTMENKKEILFEMLEKSKNEKDKSEELYKVQLEKVENTKPNPQINELENEITDLNSQLEAVKNKNATKFTEEEKLTLLDTISSLEQQMAKKQFIDKGTEQIKLWKQESREIADKLVEVENKEIQLQNFVKKQTTLITQIVNSKFENGISWSLFNENYNGSIEQDCICMYNNKRFYSLSTGERNKANIEVVKTLQNMFDVKLPIFSDNAETMSIPYTAETQVIELYATIPNGKNNLQFERIKTTKITDLY